MDQINKFFCEVLSKSLDFNEAMDYVTLVAWKKGTSDGYGVELITDKDKEIIRTFFFLKLKETGSLDEALKKAMWRAYEHKTNPTNNTRETKRDAAL